MPKHNTRIFVFALGTPSRATTTSALTLAHLVTGATASDREVRRPRATRRANANQILPSTWNYCSSVEAHQGTPIGAARTPLHNDHGFRKQSKSRTFIRFTPQNNENNAKPTSTYRLRHEPETMYAVAVRSRCGAPPHTSHRHKAISCSLAAYGDKRQLQYAT